MLVTKEQEYNKLVHSLDNTEGLPTPIQACQLFHRFISGFQTWHRLTNSYRESYRKLV